MKIQRILTLILAITMCISAVDMTAFANDTGEGFPVEIVEEIAEESGFEGTGSIAEPDACGEMNEASSEEELIIAACDAEAPEELKTASGEADAGREEYEEVTLVDPEMDLGDTYTTVGSGISLFSLDDSGKVALNSGNYEKWIDRVDVPQFARDFYDLLIENTDGDGVQDALIDYDQALTDNDATYLLAGVRSVTVAADDDLQTAYNAVFNEDCKYIRAAFDAFDRDVPGVFWLSGKTSMSAKYLSYDASTRELRYELRFTLANSSSGLDIIRREVYPTASSIYAAIVQRDTAIQGILDTVTAATIRGKLRELNNWLTTHNAYNGAVGGGNRSDASPLAWECISALLGNSGNDGPVCEGYSRAMKTLCDSLGIPCVLVDGDAGGAHMWNYVQVNGSWYAIDVTWNDPYVSSGAIVSGYEDEDYFLVGGQTTVGGREFLTSHSVNNCASQGGVNFLNGPLLSDECLPECTSHVPGEWIEVPGSEVEATCASKGSIDEAVYCTICGEEVDRRTSVTDEVDHRFTNYISNDDASCTEDGTKTAYCEYGCGTTDTVADIGSAHHDFHMQTVMAACLTDGGCTNVCSVCGATEVVSVFPARGHTRTTRTERLISPTCVTEGTGVEIEYCMDCGVEFGRTEVTIQKVTHNYKKGICSICGSWNVVASDVTEVKNVSGGVKIIWTAVPGASGYKVCRKGTGDTSYKGIAVANGTDFTDTGVESGKSYSYYIRAYGSVEGSIVYAGKGALLSVKYLARPSISKASASDKAMNVTWGKVAGASGYYVYRSVNGGAYSRVKTITSGTTVAWKDTGATANGTKYSYKVAAYYSSGSGVITKSSVSAAKTGYYIDQGTIKSLTSTSAGKAKASWTKNEAVSGYQLQYASTKDFSTVTTVTISANTTVSKTIGSLTSGKTYYFRVRSYLKDGSNYYGEWSPAVSVRVS